MSGESLPYDGVYVVAAGSRPVARSTVGVLDPTAGASGWFSRAATALTAPSHGIAMPTHYVADVRITAERDAALVGTIQAECYAAWHLEVAPTGVRTMGWSKNDVSVARDGQAVQVFELLADVGLQFMPDELDEEGDATTLFVHVVRTGTVLPWRIVRQQDEGDPTWATYEEFATKALAVAASITLGTTRAVLGLQTEVVKHLVNGEIEDRSSYGL